MDITQIVAELDSYNKVDAVKRSWTKDELGEDFFNNDYITVLEIASSNKWLGVPHESDFVKMWSIIVDSKKDFCMLSNFKSLKSNINAAYTPIRTGKFKGKYGIRLYGMVNEPDYKIVLKVLNFIFE